MTAGDMKYHEGYEVEKIVESAYEVTINLSGAWKSAISPLSADQIPFI